MFVVVIFPLDDDVGSGLLSEEVLLARLVKRHGTRQREDAVDIR